MTNRNQGDDRPGRVVVGVDPTLSGLQALRVAVGEAHRRGAALHALRAWGAGRGDPTSSPYPAASPGLGGPGWADHALAGTTPAEVSDAGRPADQPPAPGEEAPRHGSAAGEAAATVAQAFADTMGGEPDDLAVRVVLLPHAPGPVLVEYACRDQDVLVLGRGRQSRWRRPRGSPVVRYCVRRASCPVLVVPPPPLTRAGSPRSLMRQLRREIDEIAEGGADR